MKNLTICFLAIPIAFWACQPDEIITQSIEFNQEIKNKLTKVDANVKGSGTSRTLGLQQWMADVNEALLDQGIQLEKVEFLGAEREGITIFFENRGNKQLASDYVPNDPRNGNGTLVPYVIDGTELGTSSGMSELETYNATVSAMATWDAATCSSGLEIPNWGVAPFDVGYVQFILGFGGINGYFPGTVVHAGVLPADFFDAVAENGGSFILGATFTFVWNDDLDQDGRDDVAIKEIYMNDGFNWQDAPDDGLGNGIYDYETVVLHEAGHALSQAHFGKAFATENGMLHFAPAALMNAGYSVARRVVTQTDNAGHCSNWSDWPNN